MQSATFETRYEPMAAPSGGDFWTTREVLAAKPPDNQVWTVTECDGRTYVQAGYHIVNFVGYAVTAQPWHTGNEEARW